MQTVDNAIQTIVLKQWLNADSKQCNADNRQCNADGSAETMAKYRQMKTMQTVVLKQ